MRCPSVIASIEQASGVRYPDWRHRTARAAEAAFTIHRLADGTRCEKRWEAHGVHRLRAHLRQNVVAYLALFVALGGTGAYAANTIRSADVVDNSLKSIDLKDDVAVRSSDVRDDSEAGGGLRGADIAPNTLTGRDIAEPTLGRVPSSTSALVGGRGRTGEGSCKITSAQYVNCGIVKLDLPAPSRVFLTARGTLATGSRNELQGPFALCRFGSASHGPIDEEVLVVTSAAYDQVSFNAVSGRFPKGPQSLGLDCSRVTGGTMELSEVRISAVALSGE